MAQVLVPCCRRLPGPAGSQTVWVSNILLSPSRRFLGRRRIFKHILKIFVNLKGSKYLSRLESLTTKPSNKPKKKREKKKKLQRDLYGRVICTWISTRVKCDFWITVQLWHVYATAQVNTQNYLAMSQIIQLFTGIQTLTLIWVKVCN